MNGEIPAGDSGAPGVRRRRRWRCSRSAAARKALVLTAGVVLVGALGASPGQEPTTTAIKGNGVQGPVAVDAEFPGGNIVVDKIEGDLISLHHDMRDSSGRWPYWYFRVRGAAGRQVTFRFTRGDVLGLRGPALSLDDGRTWAWLGRPKDGPVQKLPSFTYAFPEDANVARFCFAIPYVGEDLARFLAKHKANPALRVETLCTTTNGRAAEVLFLGDPEASPRYHVAFMCRHHALESLANYELEGVMETVLSDSETGRWFRKHASVLVVPFVDKDGVENGDQGKNRKPHDHARDYGERSLYPTVAAIKELVPKWSGGKLDVALDLHCPGPTATRIQFVGVEGDSMAGVEGDSIWQRVCRLSRILEQTRKGPLPFASANDLPFGKAWNTNTGPMLSFNMWACRLPGTRIATSMEFPYASAGPEEVTAEKARLFGHDLAVAIRRFLETEDSSTP